MSRPQVAENRTGGVVSLHCLRSELADMTHFPEAMVHSAMIMILGEREGGVYGIIILFTRCKNARGPCFIVWGRFNMFPFKTVLKEYNG
jgi:hypothetical protein